MNLHFQAGQDVKMVPISNILVEDKHSLLLVIC